MVLKVVINVLYNICIFVCLLFVYFGIKNSNWAYVLGGAFLCALVIVFKIRLIKDIKNAQKNP
jgi:hypothetical protein